jgi:Tol biopolymer transport system component
VAFRSLSTSFAPENNPVINGVETNAQDIFLRDLKAGTTVRVTRGGGNTGDVGGSFDASVSANGAYVAFASLDREIIPGLKDCNDVHDVMVWERATGEIKMVPTGTEDSVCGTAPTTFAGAKLGNRQSQNPSISADGRYIAYSSDAYNLDPTHPDSHHYDLPQPPLSGNPRLGSNIFLWDRTTATSVRIDNAAGGAEPNGDASFVPAISHDGRFVAFMSKASDLVAGDTNGLRDTFRYDVAAGTIQLASADNDGAAQTCLDELDVSACQSYEAPSISADGRYVAFISGAKTLVIPDNNGTGRDVYVRDFSTDTTTRVNVSGSGEQAKGSSTGSAPAISGNGRHVAFTSKASNLVGGDANGVADVFVADRGAPASAGWAGPALWEGPGGCVTNCGPGGGTPNPAGSGYWMVATDGGIFAFGDAAFHGSTGDIRLNKPIVGMATTPSGNGYWLVASDGGVFSYGDAEFFGSTGNIRLAQPIVGMTTTPSGRGYWMVASDGGIFAFGDAAFYGSTGNIRLNQPIVGMTTAPGGSGYWLVASDGGIFAFGSAQFFGSTGNIRLAKPITAMTSTRSGSGYWMTATDGGIFAFGDAAFHGSAAGQSSKSIVAMSTSRTGGGYLMVNADGKVFRFGDAEAKGDLTGTTLARPIVGMSGF